jgi:cGMP-dependent protein kinase
LNLDDLEIKSIIGRGSFGEVSLVQNRTNGLHYALKAMRKTVIVKSLMVKNIQVERKIMLQLFHPNILQCACTFKDVKSIYFLLEYCGGGDLFLALREIGTLTKEQCKFFASGMILGLDYIHKTLIIHRDIKPENLLLDSHGYVKIADFGSAKEGGFAVSMVGTCEYLAPEVVLGRKYSYAVDWWSCGVVMYECICGPLPFASQKNAVEYCRKVTTEDLKFPAHVKDIAARTLLKGMLEKRPELRLACHSVGAADLFSHPYFDEYPWDSVMTRQLTAPYIPNVDAISQKLEAVEADRALTHDESEDKSDAESDKSSEESSDFGDPEPGRQRPRAWDADF